MTKMNEVWKKKGEELENLKKKVADAEEASKMEIEALQAQVAAQKNELDFIEAEVTTTVRAKLIYEYMMKRSASWNSQKEIDLYLKWVGLVKDLARLCNMIQPAAESSANVNQQEDNVFVTTATLIASNFPQGDNSDKEVVPEV
ncbi:uncharacterized protein LOC125492059 [Beta vulgaris subsp. vulgaris]|uniref:uncharacterized protein LOC125492059 n=1 Tax=Beta vulgaris subsp. vulgaris TaxID=3555 RepID=UPI0020375951|nr:uncharacterized protein LOC125492059 [Beta vulgaris subsp. vulgaris]